MKSIKYAVVLLFALLCVGCSNYVKLTGTVSFSDDNAPVEAGMVYFVSQDGKFSATGEIKNGAFAVSSLKPGDGLPKGTYNVYFAGIEKVVKESRELANGDTTEAETAPAIDLKYMSASTSGITTNVDGSTKTVDYKLDRAK